MSGTGNRLCVAVAQPLVVPGAVSLNIQRMESLVAQAAQRGAELVLLSECGLTGYDLRGIGVAAALRLNDPRLQRVDRLAKRFSLVIVAGFYEKARTAEGDRVFNSAAAFFPDGRRVLQRKHLIVGYEKNKTPVRPGPRQRELFQVKGLTLAILICADSGIRGIHAELARLGCDAALAPTAGVGSARKSFLPADLANPARRQKYLRLSEQVCFPGAAIRRALRLDVGLAACNQSGYDRRKDYFHPGHSCVVNHDGQLTALIPGCWIGPHLRPQLALGFLTSRR